MLTFEKLVDKAIYQKNPMGRVTQFLENEGRNKTANNFEALRFVGYVLELGYEKAKVITSDPYKIAVGGIPRGSFLILLPNSFENAPAHFSLLRVTGVSPTPLTNQVQQTYFELHKKSMPELDVWTQSELQWGALDCDVIGMFYPDINDVDKLAYSGDVNNVISAHHYSVFAPDQDLLDLIINGMVKPKHQYQLGNLRTMECQLRSNQEKDYQVPVKISMNDFKGCRTAMFGKTRLGKSNVVKLLAQGMIDATAQDKSVGQLIFDINGEYANDNPQDGNKSLRSLNEDRCEVYALTQRPNTPSKSLKLNFYEQPDSCIGILKDLLQENQNNAIYINAFAAVSLPSIDEVRKLPPAQQTRPLRKVQIYWAILNAAGFDCDEQRLKALHLGFDPKLNKSAVEKIFGNEAPQPSTLDEMTDYYKKCAGFLNNSKSEEYPESSTKGKPLFDSDDMALLQFLVPKTGAGTKVLAPFKAYHQKDAGHFVKEILGHLANGKTVILDLGNATDKMRRYFSDQLSKAVFSEQERKFVSNNLKDNYIQLYFEEAHNLFPPNSKDNTDVYSRFAKEGAKFHIGMIYSTQSPSTISGELLVQTENFFVAHLSSEEETKSLAKLQVAFRGIEADILRAKTPGYMRMLTMSHRFVIPVQAKLFGAP